MKHRVRKAVFDLIGTEVAGLHAIDLFAGTGALGLEAVSRGATHATLIEKHVPTAHLIQENVRTLGVDKRIELLVTSAFLWAKRDLQDTNRDSPWLVFCSPPYAFYVDRPDDMLELIRSVRECAPGGSVLVIEADDRLDFDSLVAVGSATAIDVRSYPPAVIGIWRKS